MIRWQNPFWLELLGVPLEVMGRIGRSKSRMARVGLFAVSLRPSEDAAAIPHATPPHSHTPHSHSSLTHSTLHTPHSTLTPHTSHSPLTLSTHIPHSTLTHSPKYPAQKKPETCPSFNVYNVLSRLYRHFQKCVIVDNLLNFNHFRYSTTKSADRLSTPFDLNF